MQKKQSQKIKAQVELPPLPRGSRGELYRPMPAKDGSDRYDLKCRGCGATSYMRDGDGVVYTRAQVEKARDEGALLSWTCLLCGALGAV